MRLLSILLFGLSCSDPPPDPPPPPTILRATVIDAIDGAPISGARVLLIEQGTWHELDAGTLEVTLESGTYRYRAEAPGHRAEPRPFRPFAEVEVLSAKTTELEIQLWPIDVPGGDGAIAGKVSGSSGPASGALVVATGTRIRSTYTDASGDYVLGDLPPDLYSVTAHLAGFQSSVRNGVNVTGGKVEGVDLELAPSGFVAGGRIRSGTGETRVYLVHPDVLEPIPGLYVDTNLSSVWQMTNVPPGEYRADTALELDDGWVLDYERVLREGPPLVTVSETSSGTLDLFASPSIRRIEPAKSATVSATPVLSWRAIDDADFYVVEVTDESGRTLFGGFDAGGNPRIRVLPPDVSVTYAGETLEQGARYEWRVFAGKRDPLNPTAFDVIAASEALEGELIVAE
jgi:hypothetical protein